MKKILSLIIVLGFFVPVYAVDELFDPMDTNEILPEEDFGPATAKAAEVGAEEAELQELMDAAMDASQGWDSETETLPAEKQMPQDTQERDEKIAD